MLFYIIIKFIVILIIYTLINYNGFIKLNNKFNEAFSTMDVYLKKRWDLIPNILEVVKGYAKHEKDTLKEVGCKYSPLLKWHIDHKINLPAGFKLVTVNFEKIYAWNDCD